MPKFCKRPARRLTAAEAKPFVITKAVFGIMFASKHCGAVGVVGVGNPPGPARFRSILTLI